MNLFKEIIYDIKRNYVKNYLTDNLGEVVEDNEKITCYVKKWKVKKQHYHYNINCYGIGKDEERKKTAKQYKLDKPICYVIDNLEFKNDEVCIFGYDDCEVIIKNCNFGLNLWVHVNGTCTLDNTHIQTFSYLSISADNLIIKNMSRENIKVTDYESKINFGGNNKIDVIDSNIGNKERDINVFFGANNELNFVNSDIVGKAIKCESKRITMDEKSSLTATNEVVIKGKDFKQMSINAPTKVLNGEKIQTKNEAVVIKNTTNPLSVKRLELVNLLKKIKEECDNLNSEKLSRIEKEIITKPIGKILIK